MNREEVLEVAKNYTTQDRQATHGNPEDSFGKIAEFWTVYTGHFISATDVAAMMGLLKIARIDANPTNMDNWIDLAGYSACGAELAGIELRDEENTRTESG